MSVGQGQAQAAVIQDQAAHFQGPTYAALQVVAGEGFFQKVVSPSAHGLYGQGHIAVAGDQQHRQFRVLCLQLFKQLQAVDTGHADVADHHAGPVALDARGHTVGIGQGADFQAGQVEGLAQRLTQVRVVIDQQHLGAGIDHAHTTKSSGDWGLMP